MTNMKFTPLVALFALVLAGCMTTSEVSQIGKDTYTVGTIARGGKSKAEATRNSIQAGTAYCNQMGKKFELAHQETSGVPGWTPVDSEINFLCLDENDPQYGRVLMQRDPDQVIQVK